jgi:hypothetical protein
VGGHDSTKKVISTGYFSHSKFKFQILLDSVINVKRDKCRLNEKKETKL